MTDPIVAVRLPAELRPVFVEIAQRRAPTLFDVNAGGDICVRRELLRDVQEMLGDELCAAGLAVNSEPTPYGLQIEALIDKFSPWH